MGMPIREKQVCNILINWPRLSHYSAFGPLYMVMSRTMITTPSGPYRWSLSRTMITTSSGPYRPLFRILSTAPLSPFSFLYPLLRFMQA